MKIGLSANSLGRNYGRWGKDAYLKLKEHGYACSDFSMSDTDSMLYTLPQDEADEILRREQRLAKEAGIEITQVHGPWMWPPKDSTQEGRDERMAKMKYSIRLTSVLGCKNWVIHPIMPFGIEDISSGDSEKTWAMNVSFMSELLKTAKEYDITICLENMPMLGFSLAKPQSILEFVKYMNDDHFMICLDTGHVSVFPELSLAEETRALGSAIRVLHVHDNRYSRDAHMFPCFGTIDWKPFAAALKDIGYNGSFSLETLPPADLPDNIYEKFCIALHDTAEWIISG